jgi:hypothetical protein
VLKHAVKLESFTSLHFSACFLRATSALKNIMTTRLSGSRPFYKYDVNSREQNAKSAEVAEEFTRRPQRGVGGN